MLDMKLIREKFEFVRSNLMRRGDPEKLRILDELIKCDKEWREGLTRLNELRHERKLITIKIADLKKRGEDISLKVEEARKIDVEVERLEREVEKLKAEANRLLMKLPNILHESVPLGMSEEDNVVVRTWGEILRPNFSIKDHVDLGLSLGVFDIERAAKVSGARFYYLTNEGVLLSVALVNFALNELIKRGYKPIEPPFMMRRKAYEGATALEDFEDMLYKVEDEDLYLIATSEHSIAAMFMDEVLNTEDMPLKFVGISPCFRKEAGAHGKDTRGIFRTHQFTKVEQFIFCIPEQSWELHEELIQNAEYLIRKLGLPYRVVNVCTGDIGSFAAKKYDVEVWMPAQGRYREVISCSNCTDYQARRLNIRYREKVGAPPKGFVHTLNSTALAIGRTIVAILENYQQEDGSVIVPEVLRPFLGGLSRLTPIKAF